MINVVLRSRQDSYKIIEISGHSTENADDMQGKLVCSAVSSAAIMAANTITEIIGDKADIQVDDGYLSLQVKETENNKSVISGLIFHLDQLSCEYPDRIKITMEVEP